MHDAPDGARLRARLPHRWCTDGSSIYDHLGPRLTLLRLDPAQDVTAVTDAATSRRAPLRVVDTDPARTGEDLARWGAPLLLVRPDQHVAWRAHRGPGRGDADALLDRLLGGPPPPEHRRQDPTLCAPPGTAPAPSC